ncbi:DCC1-like thiol-disulfide oxidoreductase family protein [Hoeflea sp. AS60]|uniref:DCC1-like thiol-disulfide oxidoreductase family protein n=1 Tax=Hoeflea sp. AS60 TaxID=3135780 RepID=UPI00316FBE87
MNIYYDGDCYFCTNFVKLLKLRQAVGDVHLISLREDNDDVRRILASGLNVNSGFVVEHEGKLLHGAQAFHYLNTLSDPKNILSRVLFYVSNHEWLARVLYPLMVLGRYFVLILQGGALIDQRRRPWQEEVKEGLGPRLVRIASLLLIIVGSFRIWLASGRYPLTDLFQFNVKVLTIASLLVWCALFFRARYAQQIYGRMRHADWLIVCSYIILWFLLVNSMDLIALRRIIGAIALMPLVGIAVELGRSNYKRSDAGKIPSWAPLALLVFAFFPGLFLAPFYGGIAGWTLSVDWSRPVLVGGYKLVNKQGEEIWYNHAFFQPVTMDGRFQRAFEVVDPDHELLQKFMLDNYKRIYPMLERGRMPHEWALGRLAYPSHNLSDSNALDYVGKFAPDRIAGIRYVLEQYSRAGELIETKGGELFPAP